MKNRLVHGTPITPVRLLEQLAGESFCVSFAAPEQLEQCIELQDPEGILILDNGAFSHWRAGNGNIDRLAFFDWANEAQGYCPVAVAVIPDVIMGSEETNWLEAAIAVKELSDYPERLMFCWHMDDSLDQLKRAALLFNFVAIGSCAEYDVQKNRAGYLARLREASAVLDHVELFYGRRPWVHLMRGLAVLPQAPRFESADSTNIARNHCRTKHMVGPGHVYAMARRIRATVTSAEKRPGVTYDTSNFAPAHQRELFERVA